jgi:hypothetical protein
MCLMQQGNVEQQDDEEHQLEAARAALNNAAFRVTEAQAFMLYDIIEIGVPEEAQEYIDAEIRFNAAQEDFQAALMLLILIQNNLLV